MLRFIEHKVYFYISASISLIWVAFGIYSAGNNGTIILQLIFMGALVLAMMIFYQREHKELIKALLAAYITVLFFNVNFEVNRHCI